jgi:hypothetical protein
MVSLNAVGHSPPLERKRNEIDRCLCRSDAGREVELHHEGHRTDNIFKKGLLLFLERNLGYFRLP